MTNPLYAIVKLLPSEWFSPLEALPVVGFHMKLAGVDWRSQKELLMLVEMLVTSDVLQRQLIPSFPFFELRVNPYYKDKYAEHVLQPQVTALSTDN